MKKDSKGKTLFLYVICEIFGDFLLIFAGIVTSFFILKSPNAIGLTNSYDFTNIVVIIGCLMGAAGFRMISEILKRRLFKK